MYSDLGLADTEVGDRDEYDAGAANIRLEEVPVLLSHCTDDGVVDVGHGREMRDALLALRLHVNWIEYDSDEHWVKEPEAADELVDFLVKRLESLQSA